MKTETTAPAELLTSGEVAALMRVNPRAVTKWADKGLLRTFRTPGGHRRYFGAEVRAHLAASRQERTR